MGPVDLGKSLFLRLAALECASAPSTFCSMHVSSRSCGVSYQKLSVMMELDEAVTLANNVLALCSPEHSAPTQEFLATCIDIENGRLSTKL